MSTASTMCSPTWAVSPRKPMSAIWGWAHEAGAAGEVHADDAGVVALRSTGRGRASGGSAYQRASSSRAQVTARSLVSTTAKRQNSLPVQATTPRSKGPGTASTAAAAPRRAGRRRASSATPVRTKFWSVPAGPSRRRRSRPVGPPPRARCPTSGRRGPSTRRRRRPGWLLAVHADVVAPVAAGELLAGRDERERVRAPAPPGNLSGRAPGRGSACGPEPRFSRLPSSPKSWAMARVQLDGLAGLDEDVDVRWPSARRRTARRRPAR